MNGKTLTWADTHHPGLSETNGDYDGQFLFINDKAHARMAVIDLRDFETKQIVKNPHIISNHGGAFVTPNTEYVIDGSQYAAPFGWEYAPDLRLQEFLPRRDDVLEVRPRDRADRSQPVVLDRAPAVLAGSGGRRQGSERRLVVHRTRSTPRWRSAASRRVSPRFEAGASMRDMDYL